MKTIYLVSCVSRKGAKRAAARDLYVSDWFNKARRYVERSGCPWYILSAKHGLLDPEEEIDPYNRALSHMGKAERGAWGAAVLAEMRERKMAEPGDRVVFLAGAILTACENLEVLGHQGA